MVSFHDLSDVSGETNLEWLDAIAANMRTGDLDETRATNPLPAIGMLVPLLILNLSGALSNFAWVMCDDGKAICVFGCGGTVGECCTCLLGTPAWKSGPQNCSRDEESGRYLLRCRNRPEGRQWEERAFEPVLLFLGRPLMRS